MGTNLLQLNSRWWSPRHVSQTEHHTLANRRFSHVVAIKFGGGKCYWAIGQQHIRNFEDSKSLNVSFTSVLASTNCVVRLTTALVVWGLTNYTIGFKIDGIMLRVINSAKLYYSQILFYLYAFSVMYYVWKLLTKIRNVQVGPLFHNSLNWDPLTGPVPLLGELFHIFGMLFHKLWNCSTFCGTVP